jgi:hypothetical protein
MYSRLRSSETSRLSAKQILAHRFKETGDYIAKKLKEKYSENANDTGLNGMVMSRFYTVYSQSQDYFYSNNIGSIVNEASTPLVIRYNDVQTLLDLDEYLKRFYALEEYDKKITLLAEYYKFHKDIPRVFALPTSNFLNKFHDKKRKIEYQRIKLLLFEEAQKKNKKVAMNEDDNEIR